MAKLENNPLDLRVRELNLKRGIINHKDIEQHLSELPDDVEWAAELVVYEEEIDEFATDLDLSFTGEDFLPPVDPDIEKS